MCGGGGTLVGGRGAGGISNVPLLIACKLPVKLAPDDKLRLLELKPKEDWLFWGLKYYRQFLKRTNKFIEN